MVFLILASVNKPVKFELKTNHTYFFVIVLLKKQVYIAYQIRIPQ